MRWNECFPGQLVWWLRKCAHTGAPVDRTPALVALPPGAQNNLCGLALRRPHDDDWYPMWAAPRNLAWRDVTTETIPAFFASVGAFAQRCLERRYGNLMRLVDAGATSGSIVSDDPVDNELLDLDLAAGELGLIFVRQESGGYCLGPMTDCEFNAFIAARVG